MPSKPAPSHTKALTDIWEFADLINFRGGRKNFGSIHRELTDFLLSSQYEESFENRRRLVLMSRGHLKSTVCSVLYCMWRIYRNPNIRILVGTNIKRLARGFIRELRQYFENKELQDAVWNNRPHIEGPLVPALSASDKRTRNSRRNNKQQVSEDGYEDINVADDTKLIWSGESLQMTRTAILKEPTVQVASVGTIMTGDHYDLLILDDIVDFTNSSSVDKAENLLDWTRDLESVIDPRQQQDFWYKQGQTPVKFTDYIGDEVVTLGTLYYEHDYYHYLQQEATELGIRTFKRNVYVNGYDDTEGYTWPERFNSVVVNGIKRRINNAQRFSSQYLNTVIAPSDAPFSIGLVKWFNVQEVRMRDRHAEVRVNNVVRRIKPKLFIDPAATTNNNSDFTVLGVGGFDENSELYILDMKVGKFTPTQVCEEMFKLIDKWELVSVTVEMVAGFALYRHVIEQEAKRRNRHIGIQDYRPPSKLSKKVRIETALEPHFTNGSIYCCNTLGLIDEFRTELTTFPKCKHDDVLDVIATLATLGKPTRKHGAVSASTPRRTINTQWGGTRG